MVCISGEFWQSRSHIRIYQLVANSTGVLAFDKHFGLIMCEVCAAHKLQVLLMRAFLCISLLNHAV